MDLPSSNRPAHPGSRRRHPHHRLAAGLAAVAVLGGAARCARYEAETTSKIAAALELSVPTRVLGFEKLGDWSATSGTLALVSDAFEGQAALGVSGVGYTELKSIALASDSIGPPFAVEDVLSFRLKVPTATPTSGWAGQVEVRIDVPSRGLSNRFIGTKALNGLPAGVFSQLRFPVPADIVSAVKSSFTDARIKIVLNVPVTTQSYVLDALEVGTTCPCVDPSSTEVVTCGTCPTQISFALPPGTAPDGLPVAASNSLKLADGVQVRESSGAYALVANTGPGNFQLGPQAKVGQAWSAGPATIGNNALVEGALMYAGSLTVQAGAQIGEQVTDGVVGSASFGYGVTLPTDVAENYVVEPAAPNLSLAPGNYGNVTIKTGRSLLLAGGVYAFKSLGLESGSSLVLDAAGPIQVYVRDTLIHRGNVVFTAGGAHRFLLVYRGTEPVHLESRFRGTFVAPEAKLDLKTTSSGHEGSFFARDIEVHPWTTVTHRPYSAWDALRTPVVVDPGEFTTTPSTPVPLTSATVEEFVDWARSRPRPELDRVADQIDLVGCSSGTCDASVVPGLAAIVEDDGRSLGERLVTISILGELRNPAALPSLTAWVNRSLPPVVPGPYPLSTDYERLVTLAGRAIQAVAYIGTPEALDLVLAAAGNHTSRFVRLKAIDAYLFHFGDSLAARGELHAVVRTGEQRYIGLARKATVQDGVTARAFEQKVQAYYEANPGER